MVECLNCLQLVISDYQWVQMNKSNICLIQAIVMYFAIVQLLITYESFVYALIGLEIYWKMEKKAHTY